MDTETELPAVIAPPPTLYLGAFALAMVTQAIWPLPLAEYRYVSMLVGGILFLVSAAFARWAFRTMRIAGSSPDLGTHSQALTTSGPFAVTRNPIYVAMTGLYLGAAVMLGGWWPVLMLLLVLPLMHYGVIRREERYLRKRFGEAFVSYSAKVPRWL